MAPTVNRPTEVGWPTSDDPAAFGEPVSWTDGARCGVVTGAAASAWYARLQEANQLTRWTAAGHRYALTVRPLLPGEDGGCPASR